MATQGQKQGQKRATEYIGKGNITAHTLSSPALFAKKLTQMGVEEGIVDFILATSYPKGAADKMNVSKAARTHCPNLSPLAVVSRAYSALTEFDDYNGFLCSLFHGQEASDLSAIETARLANVEEHKGTRPRLPIEERAAILAKKAVSEKFRTKKGLHIRGRIKEELTAEYEAFVTAHLEAETNKIIAKLKKGFKPTSKVAVEEMETATA